MPAIRLPISALIVATLATAASAAEWPYWRGPHGTGAAPEAKGLPAEWDGASGKNILWKVPMPGKSAATPAVWGDKVFAVSLDGDAVVLFCLNLADGKQVWKAAVGTADMKGFRSKNSPATPSPATDGKHVWVMTGGSRGQGGDLVGFDMDGKEVWRRNLQKDYGPWTQDFGSGSSFLPHNGVLYIPVLHRPDSYLLAVDGATGKTLWKTPRNTHALNESRDGYGTPAALEVNGRTEIVLVAADLATGYDAKNGKEIWRAEGFNDNKDKTWRIVTTPVVGGGMVYVPSCKSGPLLAFKAGLSGDITKTGRVWAREKDMPDQASPTLADGLVYTVKQNGQIVCLDAATGAEVWQQRPLGGANYSPSPTVADGKVFIINEQGVCLVLAHGREFKQLAVNRLADGKGGEFTLATPVALPGKLLIRSEKALYCIGTK